MLHQIVPAHPFVGIVLETAVHEVQAFETQVDVFREHVIASLNVSLEVFFVHSRERLEASQHLEEDCAQAPNISFAIVQFAV